MIIGLVTALMDHAASVPPSVGEIDPAGWLERFDEMFARVVAPAFYRGEHLDSGELYVGEWAAPRFPDS